MINGYGRVSREQTFSLRANFGLKRSCIIINQNLTTNIVYNRKANTFLIWRTPLMFVFTSKQHKCANSMKMLANTNFTCQKKKKHWKPIFCCINDWIPTNINSSDLHQAFISYFTAANVLIRAIIFVIKPNYL